MTNILAAIVVAVTTNTVDLQVLPSNKEKYVQDVIATAHIYKVGTNQFTNVIAVVSNEPVRMVWKPEPLTRLPLSITDGPPMPPGFVAPTNSPTTNSP